MPKKLEAEELQSLKQWLEEQQINSNKIHREFSDAVPVATLLKKFYPKLIDLHNYPSRNNTQLKLDNWMTLNFKALTKLGLQQSKPNLEKFAKGTPGAIEGLLFEIMSHEGIAHKNDKADEEEQAMSQNDDIMTVNVNKKVGDAIVQVPQKMILYSIYEQAVQDSGKKDMYINATHQKIAHLENLLKLKTERIEELCAQVAKLNLRNTMNENNTLEISLSNLDLNFGSSPRNDTNSKSNDH